MLVRNKMRMGTSGRLRRSKCTLLIAVSPSLLRLILVMRGEGGNFMRRKGSYALGWLGVAFGLLTVFATAVLANDLTSAGATITCTGYNFTVSATDLVGGSTGFTYDVDYTLHRNLRHDDNHRRHRPNPDSGGCRSRWQCHSNSYGDGRSWTVRSIRRLHCDRIRLPDHRYH